MKIPRIRVVLAISLDGRLAFPHQASKPLGGMGDRHYLEKSLAWADGALIGGGTIRAHCNTCLIHDEVLLKKRTEEGRPKQPIAVVISSQKDFCQKWSFFNQPIKRWLISPSQISSQFSGGPPVGYERQFFMQENWANTMSQLTKAGLKRLVLLGGAHLVGSFLQADQVDELQLTLTPKIIGGDYNWVPQNIEKLPTELSQSDAWLLSENKSIGDNELLLHYIRNYSSRSKENFKR